jgi:DNA damage-binding protein 1
LADSFGSLFKLSLNDAINLVPLGDISIPSSLSKLSDDSIFIASHYGDSQTIKLNHPINPTSFTITNSFQNIAPISDFCIKNQDGISQIIACSNAYKHGSIRIIQNGIGVQEISEIPVDNIKSLFHLKSNSELYLVLSFMNDTKTLLLKNDEILETDICFLNQETISCGKINVLSSQLTKGPPRSNYP